MRKSPVRRLGIVLIGIVLATTAASGGMIAFSPYGRQDGFPYRVMAHTVEIGAPADSVFRYLGNSANASRWSTFVHHITPLNPDSVPDGAVGSRRRCFRLADESGETWDETITVVEPSRRRQLTLYAFRNFAVSADNMATEQIYEALGPDRSRLTFTVFFKDVEPGFLDAYLMYLTAYRIHDIFKDNMRNIARIVEAGS